MMKKMFVLLSVVLIVVGVSSTVFANQNNYGCGLGSMVFEGQKDGLISQVSAATTNGTFGNQTFGITSGTSNCAQFKTWAANEKLNAFVADNMDSLAKDIAKGKGEYLDTLASLMSVPDQQKAAFSEKLQSNFSRIYPSDAVATIDVIKNIEAVIYS